MGRIPLASLERMFASIKGKVLGKSGSKVYIIVKICRDWLLSLTYNLGQNKKDFPRL